MAICAALKELLWFRNLLFELFEEYSNIILYSDNQAAITVCVKPVFHERSKHIDIRYFKIREDLKSEKLKLDYIPTSENIADLFTKFLPAPTLKLLCSKSFHNTL